MSVLLAAQATIRPRLLGVCDAGASVLRRRQLSKHIAACRHGHPASSTPAACLAMQPPEELD